MAVQGFRTCYHVGAKFLNAAPTNISLRTLSDFFFLLDSSHKFIFLNFYTFYRIINFTVKALRQACNLLVSGRRAKQMKINFDLTPLQCFSICMLFPQFRDIDSPRSFQEKRSNTRHGSLCHTFLHLDCADKFTFCILQISRFLSFSFFRFFILFFFLIFLKMGPPTGTTASDMDT